MLFQDGSLSFDNFRDPNTKQKIQIQFPSFFKHLAWHIVRERSSFWQECSDDGIGWFHSQLLAWLLGSLTPVLSFSQARLAIAVS